MQIVRKSKAKHLKNLLCLLKIFIYFLFSLKLFIIKPFIFNCVYIYNFIIFYLFGQVFCIQITKKGGALLNLSGCQRSEYKQQKNGGANRYFKGFTKKKQRDIINLIKDEGDFLNEQQFKK